MRELGDRAYLSDEPRVDRSPRILAESIELQVHDERAALEVLRDVERRDRLEEHLGAAVLGGKADPGQRPLGRRPLRLGRFARGIMGLDIAGGDAAAGTEEMIEQADPGAYRKNVAQKRRGRDFPAS